MKVGTDGVLLGAWAPISKFKIQDSKLRILDVGTGSGLVALMLAQRCPEAQIDAIDIDEAAAIQAKENFENSPWGPCMHAHRASLQEWNGGPYGLIVSNPPYFRNSLKNPDKGRELARHTDSLNYEELIKYSAKLLTEHGQLALILPAEAETEVCTLADTEGLCLTHVTRVYSKESKPARRVLMAFSRNTGITGYRNAEDILVLEDEKGGRSLPYQELCKEFYL